MTPRWLEIGREPRSAAIAPGGSGTLGLWVDLTATPDAMAQLVWRLMASSKESGTEQLGGGMGAWRNGEGGGTGGRRGGEGGVVG